MVRCSVLGCKSDSERKIPDLSFHSFPLNEKICEKWIEATGRTNWTAKQSSRICSRHFEQHMLFKTNKLTVLLPNAVPSLAIKGFVPSRPSMSLHGGANLEIDNNSSTLLQKSTSCIPRPPFTSLYEERYMETDENTIQLNRPVVVLPSTSNQEPAKICSPKPSQPLQFLFAPLSETYIQDLEPAAPNTTLLQPGFLQESRASTLELLPEIPPGTEIIARVYKYLQKEYEELKARSGDAPALSSLGDILGRTAAATGVSQRAVSEVLEADALKPYQGKRVAKPVVGERKRPKYNSEKEDVSPIKEESDDDDGDGATQEEPCEQENGEDEGLIETLKLEFYEDDDYEVSSAIQNLIASTVSRTQEGEVTKPATCSSADPLTDTPHAVKEEIPDDEYRTLEPQMFARTYSRHGTPGKSRVQVKVEPIDEQSHTEPIDNATDDT